MYNFQKEEKQNKNLSIKKLFIYRKKNEKKMRANAPPRIIYYIIIRIVVNS